MRVVEKIAFHSLARAALGESLGNTAAAHAGVAPATMVQLISWRVMRLECGTVGSRNCAIGAAHLIGIFVREQRGIGSGNGQARSAALERSGHAVVKPLGRVVETRVGRVPVAEQCGLLVVKKRGDQRSAGAIGVLGDATRQRQGVERGRHHELLSRFEAQADIDGHCG